MKTAIILHGTCDKEEYFDDKYPSLSNSHWLPWLQKQLLIKGIFTQTPEMPDAYKPNYSKWKKEFSRFDVDENTFLVGYSAGGGFLVRWLSENKVNIAKLILVAPWMDPERKETTDFFNFDIDRNIQERTQEIHILISNNEDTEGVNETIKTLESKLPKAKLHKFENMGHFTYGEMKTEEFPALLSLILKW